MAPQRVDERGALADQLLAHRLRHGVRLGLSALDRYEAHARTARRFADRLCIGAIVLAAFHERLDVLRRDQAHVVSKPGQLTPPVMRSTARLERDRKRRLFGEMQKKAGALELQP